jgi:pancreatic lipase-related protein 2
VDVIHTCAGTLGHDDNLGHVDFYPNRGKQPQPGCSADVVGACSHGKSYHYFADSIGDDGKDYEGYHCPNWSSFKNGTCEQKPVKMGDKTPRSARGMFFLETD